MADYEKILLAVTPHGNKAIIAGFAAALPQCIAYADLTPPARLADFIAQCAHESAGFTTTTEFASGVAYEGRKDLGNTQKGDGRKFRGRGLIQDTGRAIYAELSKVFGVDFIANPEKLAEFPYAALAAAHFWKTRDLNKFADSSDFKGETKRINGGYNGLASREAYQAKAKFALADLKGALIAAAADETQKATVKAASAGTVSAATAVSAAGATPVVQNTISPFWAVAVAAVGIAAIVALIIAINHHKAAAADLIAAAQGA